VTGNRGREICQDVKTLQIAGFGDRQQSSRGQFASGTAVAEADFAPLNASAQCSFGAIVGGVNAFVLEESKQALVVLEQSHGEIADFAVVTIQVLLGQGDDPLLDRDRA